MQTQITIKEAIESIRKREWLIPDFQREFVWDTERITNLWDSVLRGYPIPSMLFWDIKAQNPICDFYPFIADQHKDQNTISNIPVKNLRSKFSAVLDGQQRLTSLLIGLYGSYSETRYKKTTTSHLYLLLPDNVGKVPSPKNINDSKVYGANYYSIKYEFSFINEAETNTVDVYVDKDNKCWFRVGKIVDFKNAIDITSFYNSNSSKIPASGLGVIIELWNQYSSNYKLTCDAQTDQEDAFNMFLRINTGVKPLSMADIIMSMITARWSDGRNEIKKLVKSQAADFSLTPEFIVKCLLCLYGKNVKYSPTNIDTTFVTNISNNWSNISDSMDILFSMLTDFGLSNKKFSLNALIPLFCYLYWNKKGTTSNPIDSADKEEMHRWLLKTLILQSFSKTADTVISRAIQPFDKGNKKHNSFPSKDVSKEIGQKSLSYNEIGDFLDELQYSDKMTYFILSLLHLGNFTFSNPHQIDHLHPKDYIKNGTLTPDKCNSIVNLQILDATANGNKSSLPLKDWVSGEPNPVQRKKDSFIPSSVSLDINDYDDFYKERRDLMIKELLPKFK